MRPATDAHAEFQRTFKGSKYILAGKVAPEWLAERSLARGALRVRLGQLVNVEDLTLRMQLQHEHAALLENHGFRHLDISVLRGSCRDVTQVIGRSLYLRDAAGLLFKSTVDDKPCVALFEGRAFLEATATVIPLTEYPELNQVLRRLELFRPFF